MELRAGARGWVVACTLGIGASLVSARRGVPTESTVDMWAIVCGVALGGLEGEHKSMTGFVAGVASVGSMGSSVGRLASVLEAVSWGAGGRRRSMRVCVPSGL